MVNNILPHYRGRCAKSAVKFLVGGGVFVISWANKFLPRCKKVVIFQKIFFFDEYKWRILNAKKR